MSEAGQLAQVHSLLRRPRPMGKTVLGRGRVAPLMLALPFLFPALARAEGGPGCEDQDFALLDLSDHLAAWMKMRAFAQVEPNREAEPERPTIERSWFVAGVDGQPVDPIYILVGNLEPGSLLELIDLTLDPEAKGEPVQL